MDSTGLVWSFKMREENSFTYLGEVNDIIENIKKMQDLVLDVYKYEPIKSKKLLKDLEELKKEASILNKKFLELA
jgi:hypothetical protein